ncbi:hypothetical protein Tco_1579405 [Tanacetum coccineum]
MSSMGELTFFLRLQVKQKEDGIFISQDKYVAEILKKFDFASVKTTSTPIKTQKPLVKDEEATDVICTDIAKSQENGQNRTNTYTGTDRVHKSQKFLAKGHQKSTLGL